MHTISSFAELTEYLLIWDNLILYILKQAKYLVFF
jgi:hypothetical protein